MLNQALKEQKRENISLFPICSLLGVTYPVYYLPRLAAPIIPASFPRVAITISVFTALFLVY